MRAAGLASGGSRRSSSRRSSTTSRRTPGLASSSTASAADRARRCSGVGGTTMACDFVELVIVPNMVCGCFGLHAWESGWNGVVGYVGRLRFHGLSVAGLSGRMGLESKVLGDGESPQCQTPTSTSVCRLVAHLCAHKVVELESVTIENAPMLPRPQATMLVLWWGPFGFFVCLSRFIGGRHPVGRALSQWSMGGPGPSSCRLLPMPPWASEALGTKLHS